MFPVEIDASFVAAFVLYEFLLILCFIVLLSPLHPGGKVVMKMINVIASGIKS